MYVSITPVPTRDTPPANYSVWIDYDGKTQINFFEEKVAPAFIQSKPVIQILSSQKSPRHTRPGRTPIIHPYINL
jgi:hypothetical protein